MGRVERNNRQTYNRFLWAEQVRVYEIGAQKHTSGKSGGVFRNTLHIMEEKSMKIKTTRKAIMNGSTNLRYAGYCDLSYLLHNYEPIAYTSGFYGWNFDVFEVYGITICTSYRGMPGTRLQAIEEYEEKPVLFGGIMVNHMRNRDRKQKCFYKNFVN